MSTFKASDKFHDDMHANETRKVFLLGKWGRAGIKSWLANTRIKFNITMEK